MSNEISVADRDNLQAYAVQIKELDEVVREGVLATAHNMAQVGTLLLNAKAICPPDHWTDWVEKRCGFPYSRAVRYIGVWQVARDQKLTALATADRLLKFMVPDAMELDATAEAAKTASPEPEEPPQAPSPPNTSPEPEKRDTATHSQPEAAPTASTPKPVKVTATLVVPDAVEARIKQGAGLYNALVRELDTFVKKVQALAATEYGVYLPRTEIMGQLKNARQALRFGRPYKPCPYCKVSGGGRRGCRTCKKQKWVTEGVWKSAPAASHRWPGTPPTHGATW